MRDIVWYDGMEEAASMDEERGRATFWVPKRQLEWLKQRASVTGRSQGDLLREALDDAIAKAEAKAGFEGWSIDVATAAPDVDEMARRLREMLPGASVTVTATKDRASEFVGVRGQSEDGQTRQAIYRAIAAAQESAAAIN